MHHIVLVVPYYLFIDRIEEVGDQWTLDGYLGGDLIGDHIGGFGIANKDVRIWEGGEWSRGSAPPSGARGPVRSCGVPS